MQIPLGVTLETALCVCVCVWCDNKQRQFLWTYSIHWLLCPLEMECVHCEVRNEYICMCIYIYIYIVVSRRPLTAEARVRFQLSSCEVCGRHWDKFFSEHLCFTLSISFHQCSILIYIYTLLLPGEHIGRILGTFQKAMFFHKSGRIFGYDTLNRNTNKMQLCNRIYYSKVFFKGSTCFERHTVHHQEL